MKRKVMTVVLALMLVFGGLFAHAAVSGASKSLVFDDEFSGQTLDLSKWQPNWFGANNTTITKPVNGAEKTCYDPAQVSESGGNLNLDLVSRTCKADNGVTYSEATGSVSTLHSFSFTSGTLRVRVYLPGDSSGLYNWPAVWTDGLGQWPHTGESDILEGLSGQGCYHYHSDAGGPGGCIKMSGGWHTVSEIIKNGVATYKYDKHVVGTEQVVNSPHFIILGNQDGTYGGKQVLPTRMQIAWIRVYA